MNFKEWLQIDEIRFKGLNRMFRNAHPNLPKYVANDLYNARIGHTMNRIMGSKDGDSSAGSVQYPSPIYKKLGGDRDGMHDAPSKIFNAFQYQNVKWSGPIVLQGRSGEGVTPADFNRKTQSFFVDRRFGFREEQQIPNDANRTKLQKQITSHQQPGTNEPVIVMQTAEGFELLEGWHRTMNLLLSGASEEQLEIVKTGYQTEIDFSQWKPVKIQAYMGNDPKNQYTIGSNSSDMSGTGGYVPAGTGEYIPQSSSA